jgi:hypothetical protein
MAPLEWRFFWTGTIEMDLGKVFVSRTRGQMFPSQLPSRLPFGNYPVANINSLHRVFLACSPFPLMVAKQRVHCEEDRW